MSPQREPVRILVEYRLKSVCFGVTTSDDIFKESNLESGTDNSKSDSIHLYHSYNRKHAMKHMYIDTRSEDRRGALLDVPLYPTVSELHTSGCES